MNEPRLTKQQMRQILLRCEDPGLKSLGEGISSEPLPEYTKPEYMIDFEDCPE